MNSAKKSGAHSTSYSSISPSFWLGRIEHFDVIYNEHNVTLAVTAVPELEQYALFLAGLGLMAAIGRHRTGESGTPAPKA